MPYKCPIKQKAAQHRSYLRNIEITKKRALEHKHRDQERFKALKKKMCANGCTDCGFKGIPQQFDFHHIDPNTKILCVADMLGTYGRKKVLAEINKCEILCKPCHKKHH